MQRSAVWEVKIEDEAAAVFESGKLTSEDKIVIQNWALLIQSKGPKALQKRPGVWADHPLFGEWRGYRSSSFSHSGRIIYRVEADAKRVVVARITHDHDYRRGKR